MLLKEAKQFFNKKNKKLRCLRCGMVKYRVKSDKKSKMKGTQHMLSHIIKLYNEG